ncbi:TetR/AcrR family transcriptional regulator [Burkholderia sp. Ac-20344]|uniref:TetR/AcrR family transcriptional regulator n=1 Tax=Burkholderia sp. Ac-20344 TaxID=2703890 RepID=UPI00197C6766|nr:TetR/AcrR family transcriptional regulator [Burkholderia sp. Ac-20344]MBN3835225.1 TetR family transcriptional regulator [Burkholderia sp. Ac-20344]
MKRSKADTAATRARVVEVAAQTFARNGIRATGVAEIMAAAGLTHGAFYRHFESKEQLVAEACAVTLESLVGSAESVAGQEQGRFLLHLESFLTSDCNEGGLAGCPFVAMGSELARADADTRRIATKGFSNLVDLIATRYSHMDGESARAAAIYTLTTMIGAVTMSRIVDDAELSNQIIETAKARLVDVQAGADQDGRTRRTA